MAREENLSIENARIIFRNFSGKPDKFNSQGGKRTFCVVIDNLDDADRLEAAGWNIKRFNKRDDEEEPGAYLPIKVSYNSFPPHIYICANKRKTLLNEDTVGTLDYADISSVDIIISPYHYDVSGRQGISAYVKTMYVNVIVDEFASKYEDDDDIEELPF